MRKLLLSLGVMCVGLIRSVCADTDLHFELFDDAPAGLTAAERALWATWTEDALLVEDFADPSIDEPEGVNRANFHDGVLEVDRDGTHLHLHYPAGFTRAIVCSKLTSLAGHLFTPISSPDGHYALFNDVLGDWAWLDFENGRQKIRCELFGLSEGSNRDRWVVHELRVEGERLSYYVNNHRFGSVPFSQSRKMTNFAVAANIGGRAVVDYVIIADQLAPGEHRYRFGDTRIVCSKGYELEAVVPPNLTASAPFDTTIAPDGSVLMAGTRGRMARVSLDGTIERSKIPMAGRNFECTHYGTLWYYDVSSGWLSRWSPGEDRATNIARVPAAYSDGSIAVAPDGEIAYIGWWIRDIDPSKEGAALFRYTDSTGLRKLLELPRGVGLRVVEAAPDGTVYLATTEGIQQLSPDGSLIPVCRFTDLEVSSDGLTSDRAGNLYFTAYGTGHLCAQTKWRALGHRSSRKRKGTQSPLGAGQTDRRGRAPRRNDSSKRRRSRAVAGRSQRPGIGVQR